MPTIISNWKDIYTLNTLNGRLGSKRTAP